MKVIVSLNDIQAEFRDIKRYMAQSCAGHPKGFHGPFPEHATSKGPPEALLRMCDSAENVVLQPAEGSGYRCLFKVGGLAQWGYIVGYAPCDGRRAHRGQRIFRKFAIIGDNGCELNLKWNQGIITLDELKDHGIIPSSPRRQQRYLNKYNGCPDCNEKRLEIQIRRLKFDHLCDTFVAQNSAKYKTTDQFKRKFHLYL